MSCKGVAKPVHVRALWAACCSSLVIALSACVVDFKDGVFACSSSADCPAGLQCHPLSKRCTRQPFGTTEVGVMLKPDGAVPTTSDAHVSEAVPSDAGHASVEERADAATSDAGPSRPGQEEASPASADPARSREAAGADAGHAGAAGSGGSRDSGGAAGSAGAGGAVPSGPEAMPADCPSKAYCYGFELGALDPSGALWPSPSDDNGGLPPNGELTASEYPASSRNMMLISRPSSKGSWPKATVGFTGPRTPFDRLVVSFDYIAGDKLVEPNPRVILFRFVGMPARNGDSVSVGLLANDAMLEVQTSGSDTLDSIGPAAKPGSRTQIVATFERSQASCTVTAAYGDAQPKAAAFPCEVESWQIEVGLDMLETPPDRYTQDYVAYFDDLRVIATP